MVDEQRADDLEHVRAERDATGRPPTRGDDPPDEPRNASRADVRQQSTKAASRRLGRLAEVGKLHGLGREASDR
jgi:hypothetical protein